MKAAGIILAAGRGSRMKEFTAEHPKCMVELAGKALLQWQLQSLHKANVERILVVRGYAAACIKGEFETTENTRWASTNMLSTLFCANHFARDVFSKGFDRIVVSYSDIVYHCDHVCKILSCDKNISITFDTQWEELWKLRFANVLLDAETFLQENGLLQDIGGKPESMSQIQGQYMGLLAFDRLGWQTFTELGTALGDALDKTDMTSFLRLLLGKSIRIGAVPVSGKWCEVDSGTDLQCYENALAQGNWSHDWR